MPGAGMGEPAVAPGHSGDTQREAVRAQFKAVYTVIAQVGGKYVFPVGREHGAVHMGVAFLEEPKALELPDRVENLAECIQGAVFLKSERRHCASGIIGSDYGS